MLTGQTDRQLGHGSSEHGPITMVRRRNSVETVNVSQWKWLIKKKRNNIMCVKLGLDLP